jgi:hypothetical protein
VCGANTDSSATDRCTFVDHSGKKPRIHEEPLLPLLDSRRKGIISQVPLRLLLLLLLLLLLTPPWLSAWPF